MIVIKLTMSNVMLARTKQGLTYMQTVRAEQEANCEEGKEWTTVIDDCEARLFPFSDIGQDVSESLARLDP